MDENNQPIVYVVDTRNADHRTGYSQPQVSRAPVPIGATRVAPTPYYGQPRVIYAQQPAYAQPYSQMQSWFGNVSKGEVVDLIIQGLVALTPPPDAPNSTGDIGTDLGNLMLYQGAVTTYEKRDEQLRTLAFGLRKLLR